MAASQQLDTVIEMLKARLALPLKTVEENRASYEQMMSRFKLEDDVTCERVGAGGVPAEWITAPGAREDRIMVYLHGGAYLIGSMRSHRVALSLMSRAAGVRVLGLDYRLAPEHTFPAPVQDTIAAYRWLLSNGADPKKIVFGGDSAGGGLTLAAFVALRYLGEPMPAAGVCISPWTDLDHTGDSMITNAEVDPSISRDRLAPQAKIYLGGKDARAPLASPLYADMSGLPPLLLMVGSVEVLVDDSTRVADRAKAAGVDATLEIWDDMPHNWPLFAPILPEGQQAIDRMGEFIREHTG